IGGSEAYVTEARYSIVYDKRAEQIYTVYARQDSMKRELEPLALACRTLCFTLITLLIVMLLAPSLLATSNAAAVNVKVNNDSVTVKMSLQVIENIATLPAIDLSLDRSNASLTPVVAELQRIAPNARIELLTLHAMTAQINQTTNLWVFQDNY